MTEAALEPEMTYTLLCVRPDGVASIVDLLTADDVQHVRHRAEALLREHRSARHVEVWRDGALLEQLEREANPAL